jgi:hypothetical protein
MVQGEPAQDLHLIHFTDADGAAGIQDTGQLHGS